MRFTEFLEEMKARYGDGMSVKLNDDGEAVPENCHNH